jgi:hypothetical protein
MSVVEEDEFCEEIGSDGEVAEDEVFGQSIEAAPVLDEYSEDEDGEGSGQGYDLSLSTKEPAGCNRFCIGR